MVNQQNTRKLVRVVFESLKFSFCVNAFPFIWHLQLVFRNFFCFYCFFQYNFPLSCFVFSFFCVLLFKLARISGSFSGRLHVHDDWVTLCLSLPLSCNVSVTDNQRFVKTGKYEEDDVRVFMNIIDSNKISFFVRVLWDLQSCPIRYVEKSWLKASILEKHSMEYPKTWRNLYTTSLESKL